MSKFSTNEEFARHDKFFRDCCRYANVEPSARQASKFRRGVGQAYVIGRLKVRDAQGESNEESVTR